MRLGELAERAGIPPRTVRYYVQRGLLPAPRFRGPDTAYEEEHLLRLRAIRRLQARFLPLDAIQVELERLTPEKLRAVAEGKDTSPLTAVSASAAAPRASISAAGDGTAWERWELAPGLELHLSQTAGAASRALAEKLREVVKSSRTRRPNEH